MSPVPEGVLEFPLHSLHVRILHQEGRTQLAEFTDLDLSGTVLKDFKYSKFEFGGLDYWNYCNLCTRFTWYTLGTRYACSILGTCLPRRSQQLAIIAALAYLVDLCEEFLELVLRWAEAHGPHDLPEVVSGQEVNLLRVEQVKTHLGTNRKMAISLFLVVKFYFPFYVSNCAILPTVYILNNVLQWQWQL